jgi:hypothetical protein
MGFVKGALTAGINSVSGATCYKHRSITTMRLGHERKSSASRQKTKQTNRTNVKIPRIHIQSADKAVCLCVYACASEICRAQLEWRNMLRQKKYRCLERQTRANSSDPRGTSKTSGNADSIGAKESLRPLLLKISTDGWRFRDDKTYEEQLRQPYLKLSRYDVFLIHTNDN